MACLICKWAVGFAAASFLVSVRSDEVAFVDVSSSDAIDIRSLDVAVRTMPGAGSFFLEDPMASHDWASQKLVRRTLVAEVRAATRSDSSAADKISLLETAMEGLYVALPKNEDGLLGNETVRYALHRFFRAKHGWSIKGLEPAGSAWIRTLSVESDVQQVTKYIVPAFLLNEVLGLAGGRGLNLRWLAVLAATLEHLIHGETMEYIYSVLRTLGVPVQGPWSEEEVDEIMSTFMVVYAFGSDLEVSTRRHVRGSRRYLDAHHQGWRDMQDLIKHTREMMPAAAHLSFGHLVRLAEELGQRYAGWQSQDCRQALEELKGLPGQHGGRVPLAEVRPLNTSGSKPRRRLFTESVADLLKLGVLDEQQSSLIIPNYMASQAMCLTTASYYRVCCPSDCETLLEHLEKELAVPSASPRQIAKVLQEAAGSGGSTFSQEQIDGLAEIAGRNGGSVPMHGKDLSQWLHSFFPDICPASQEQGARTNPKTADQWMTDPGSEVEETEELIAEVSEVLSRYITLRVPKEEGDAAAQLQPRAGEEYQEGEDSDDDNDVMVLQERADSRKWEGSNTLRRSRISSVAFQAISALSMLGLAYKASSSVLHGAVGRGEGTKKKERKKVNDASWHDPSFLA